LSVGAIRLFILNYKNKCKFLGKLVPDVKKENWIIFHDKKTTEKVDNVYIFVLNNLDHFFTLWCTQIIVLFKIVLDFDYCNKDMIKKKLEIKNVHYFEFCADLFCVKMDFSLFWKLHKLRNRSAVNSTNSKIIMMVIPVNSPKDPPKADMNALV